MTVTPSDIIQYRYCPRFIYFERVMRIPQFEDKYTKVLAGRHLHDERLERNKDYLRKRLGVVAREDDVYLVNDWLRGRVDEVLTLKDGTMAPLDYKFARYQDWVYDTYYLQLMCYALLIEDHYGRKVRQGYLVYTRSRNKVIPVAVDREKQALAKQDAETVIELIQTNRFPKATRVKSRCRECTYRNICPQ